MAKRRAGRPAGGTVKSALKYSEYAADLFRQLGWEVQVTPKGGDRGADFSLIRADGFLYQCIPVDVKATTRPITAEAVRALAGLVASSAKITGGMLVADSFTRDAEAVASRLPNVNLVTFKRLEDEVARVTKSRQRRARTTIGRAILANQPQIAVASAALVVLIDERLATLRNERPNSPEATEKLESTIRQYERLKADVVSVADVAAKFKDGTIDETAAVESSKSLLDGIHKWWNKSHGTICERAFDMGLFATAVSICSMAGAGGKVAVAVSAALVGGKQLSTALKGLKGLWS